MNKMKKNKIADKLRSALWFSTFLTILVGLVGLLSWYQQNRQVNYILSDYLPQEKIVFKLEDNFNYFINDFNEFSNLTSNVLRAQFYEQLSDRIEKIQDLVIQINDINSRKKLLNQITELNKILFVMDRNIYKNILYKQNLDALNTKISWLHDDFNNELFSLIQEINWQQSSIFDQKIEDEDRKRDELNKLQLELQHIYNLSYIEGQLRNELLNLIYSESPDQNQHYSFSDSIINLKSILNNGYVEKYPNVVTLHQLLNTFFDLLSEKDGVPFIFNEYQQSKNEFNQIIKEKDMTLTQVRNIVEQQVLANHDTLNQLNENLKSLTFTSGILILVSILFALIFLHLFNNIYIRNNLIKRFTALSQSVALLSQGNLDTPILVDGNDEITRVAKFLRIFCQTARERREIEQNLRDTQDELIQAAKLATVGKTMTILAHEINQPLNALSIYLFNVQKLLGKEETHTKKESYAKANEQLTKMSLLIERINNIIKQLRQFTKRSSSNDHLVPLELRENILIAWELLKLQHKANSAKLSIIGDSRVLSDAIRIEQVFVNLFNNALEACHSVVPQLKIEIQREQNTTQVRLSDNGTGWNPAYAEQLIRPFVTTKKVGLGLGLSICQTIMQQSNGALYIASTLDKHAQIILIFQNGDMTYDS